MGSVGISCYDLGVADFLELAQAADQLGFDTLWLGEHIVRPLAYQSAHPRRAVDAGHQLTKPVITATTRLLDPWVALGAAAAVTSRINLATGIYLLTLRHPLVTSRGVATAMELSAGRIRFGVGAGWLEEEFDAVGVPYAGRFGRFEEAIDIIRLALSGQEFDYQGRHYCIGPVQVTPARVPLPLILAGNGPRALARAARLGDGWLASATPTFDDAADLHRRIVELRGRTEADSPFDCYFRIPDAGVETVDRYGAAGMTNVVVWSEQVWVGRTLAQRRDCLAAAAARLGLS